MLATTANAFSKADIDSVFSVLFTTMENEKTFIAEKENRIYANRQMLEIPDLSLSQRYFINLQLYYEYCTYKVDSAIYYMEINMKIAEQLQNIESIYQTKLNLSFSYWIKGRFLEAVQILGSMNRQQFDNLPKWLLIDYFEAYKRIYIYYSMTAESKESHYYTTSNLYRDSLLQIVPSDGISYHVLMAEKLTDENQTEAAKQMLLSALRMSQTEDHERAILNNVLANIYKKEGNVEMQKKYFALSAICDIKNAIKENSSMMSLALLLFEEGDIDNSYKCIKFSLDDAVFCNARFRAFEISKVFPIIDAAYQNKTNTQKSKLQKYLYTTSLLSLFLIIAVFYVSIQMKRYAKIRQELYSTNTKLNELNTNLHESNVKLNELNKQHLAVNQKLKEANRIKEAYLGKFVDLCSNYIEKLNNYRRQLNRIANNGKMDELIKSLKSSQFIEDELNEFYANFDETFLRIYPTFINDFNALFPKEEQQKPKQNELLNTELRIYALIRLGITDSVKISVFLRYSITTIYTYRSKLKNKSFYPENFEEQVMKIGIM
jgi:cell division protein FtsL